MTDWFVPKALSVSELNSLADRLLQDGLVGFWVSGEVSNWVCAASGHQYFVLKDAHAQVRCALFKHAASRLAVPLCDGDHIEVSGKIGLYEVRGDFQINVTQIRRKGLGLLYERYELLKKRLQQEGLFAPERKQAIPKSIGTVGIVSSLGAAALHDVVTTLRRRAPDVAVIVYPTPVQGEGSALKIAEAVKTAASRAEVDVLLLCRGGGSIEDLWAFNEEIVVRAVSDCVIPLICGVGHETDFTLTDFVADVRAPTPTAAAELAVLDVSQRMAVLEQYTMALKHAFKHQIQTWRQQTEMLSGRLRHPRQHILLQHDALVRAEREWRRAISTYFVGKQEQLLRQQRLLTQFKPNVVVLRQRLKQHQLHWQRAKTQWLENQHNSLLAKASLLDAVSPKQILLRGFAVVKDEQGHIVRDAQEVQTGQVLRIVLANGEIDVCVSSGRNKSKLFG